MARKRVDGRFVKDGGVPGERETAGLDVAGALVGAPRPRQCRTYVRKRMAEVMPLLVEMLLKQANTGSLGHLKVLVQLAGLDKGEVSPPVKRREKTLEQVLLDQWAKDAELVAVEKAEAEGMRAVVEPTSGDEAA